MEKGGSPEQMTGITVKAIEYGELGDYKDKIRALEYNVLDTSRNQRNEGSSLERKEVIHHMAEDMKGPGKYDLVLVAEKNDKVVGFIYIGKDGSSATVQEFWVSTANGSQRPIISELIDSAAHRLQNDPTHQYPKLHVIAVTPSQDFGVVCSEPDRARSLVIQEEGEGSGTVENV